MEAMEQIRTFEKANTERVRKAREAVREATGHLDKLRVDYQAAMEDDDLDAARNIEQQMKEIEDALASRQRELEAVQNIKSAKEPERLDLYRKARDQSVQEIQRLRKKLTELADKREAWKAAYLRIIQEEIDVYQKIADSLQALDARQSNLPEAERVRLRPLKPPKFNSEIREISWEEIGKLWPSGLEWFSLMYKRGDG
jgi:hypothetical protein